MAAATTQAVAPGPGPAPAMATTQAAAPSPALPPASAMATTQAASPTPPPATASSGVRYRYTSARMTTQRHYTVRYGRIEVRAKLPEGQGIWPAVWLLGADIPTRGWPACGEIDLLELVGSRPGTVHGTIHGPLSGGVGIGGAYTLPGGQKFSEDFHVFSLEWDERSMHWFVDGHQYFQVLKDDMPAEYAQKEWVYDHDFFLIVNLAVGGNWPGYPDETTIFPQSLQIDYIRVYQREN
ncbi:MAG: glycoside hydrolase family 16 protein [Limnochordaceae bacterium]|nr:glycoside hydrolase family 16 protein [Limnochordaceae bacterium]